MTEGEGREDEGIIRFDENGNGHFIRQVFYTPDYTLSTMTLDPARQYHHCGTLAQTMGATFAADAKSRIIVTGRGYYSTQAINGAPVNLNPKKTYDSPFLSMEHGANKALITYPGSKDEVLDFGSQAKSQ